MPVDYSAPAPAVRPIPHIRKLAFIGGALVALLAISLVRLVFNL